MSTETQSAYATFSPHYCIINRSEPRYDLIRKILLGTRPHANGSSRYFIHATGNNRCICRIRPGNGTVLFYEILDHCREGISGEEIWDAILEPSNASPYPGYFYITPEIERKLRASRAPEHPGCTTMSGHENLA